MDLQDKVFIKLTKLNVEKNFIFDEDEYNWDNTIEIEENTMANLCLNGDSETKLYLDGINILLSEAESENELKVDKANKYYVDQDGEFVRFSQKEIILFGSETHPLYGRDYMNHILFPGYYRLMVVTPNNKKYFSWLRITPKQISEEQLDSLKKDLEETIQGLSKRFDKNENGMINSKDGISQNDLKTLEILCGEERKFNAAIYRIINNPQYKIKDKRFWSNRLISSTDNISIIETVKHPDKESFYSKKRYISYALRDNEILKKQILFLFKKISLLTKKINNYLNLCNRDFKEELEILAKYKKVIIQFFELDWVSEIKCDECSKMENDVYNFDYLYINKLIKRIKHQENNKIIFNRQYKYYYHRTDVLYEVWAYVKIIKVMSDMGFKPIKGWFFDKDNIDTFGELREGETVISVLDDDEVGKSCKYVKIIYDKAIENKDESSPVKMATGYTHKRPDIRIELYDKYNKVISLIIIDTKYRLYNSIFRDKNHTLKQFIEYVNGIEIKGKYKSESTKKIEQLSGQTSLKNSLFILYPKYSNSNKPKVRGEDNQYRINLVPGNYNEDLYHYLKERIDTANDFTKNNYY